MVDYLVDLVEWVVELAVQWDSRLLYFLIFFICVFSMDKTINYWLIIAGIVFLLLGNYHAGWFLIILGLVLFLSLRPITYFCCIVLGVFLFSTGQEFLGLIICFSGIVVLLIDISGGYVKDSVEQLSKTPGTYPEGKLREYTNFTAKKTAEGLLNNVTELDYNSFAKKITNFGKNFFDEIGKLFK
jgi:hypothetical protein